MTLVTDAGFADDAWHRPGDGSALEGCRLLVPLARLDEAFAVGVEPVGVELAADVDLTLVTKRLGSIALIALRFDRFADGRGFSLARRLRQLGFAGRLRATGHVIVDQWAFLRDCGIDEAEIDDELARRQPEASWRAASTAISGSYQRRLMPTADIGRAS